MPEAGDPLEGLGSNFRGERSTDLGVRMSVSGDASSRRGLPSARVRPRDVTDVEALVRWARTRRQPLVARGGGTSLNGESVPAEGAVVVDLSGWNAIGEVDRIGGSIRVGPGVVNRDLHERLKGSGWFFPPNPGSWRSSTIGGNVATNASGPRSLKYGPTRRWVREVEAVLGTGERVRIGTPLPKRSVGPDLLGLWVGSEGTLGIATEILLGLARAPTRRVGLVIPIPEGTSLARVAGRLVGAGELGLSALEYVDRGCADALSEVPSSRIPAGSALLLAEVESSDEEDETRRLERWSGFLPGVGLTADPIVYADADRLWTIRGESGITLDDRLGPRIREDIVVPLARLDEMVGAIVRLAREHGTPALLYGHLGDGNLHPNFVVDPGSPRGAAVRAAVLDAAGRLGGSASGEHGIGSIKRERLWEELGAPMVRALRAIKASCDPDGILNPGKLLPDGGG